MSALGGWWRRLVLLFTRDQAMRDLEDEMRLHREMRAEANRAAGADGDEAEEAARHRFGNAAALGDASRDEWGWRSFDELAQDVRYAARRLRQRPGFTFGVCAVLALGIGATTAVFSAVDAAMLRPLPFDQPERLIATSVDVPFSPGALRPRGAVQLKRFDITDVMAMPETFTSVAAFASGGLNLSDAEHPVRVRTGVVSEAFFATLGVQPSAGRTFQADDVSPDAPGRLILSWNLWQRQFGGAPIIDSVVPLNGRPYQVIGIMPRGFSFPDQSELWIPMSIPTTPATFEPFRGYLSAETIARLAPGVTTAQANTRMLARWEQWMSTVPAGSPLAQGVHEHFQELQRDGVLKPLRDTLVGERRLALLVLFGATVCLLMIACANVTNLLLCHAAARRREIAVRAVLGATRPRVIRQLLTESIMLAGGGALLGIAVAPLVLRVLSAMMPAALRGVAPARLDLRVLGFATLLSVVTGIAFGVWPALGFSRLAPGDAMRAGSDRVSAARGARRLQRLLVGAELALTVTLLIGAGLMLRSFRALVTTESGLDASHVATLEMAFGGPSARGVSVPQRFARIDEMLARVRAVPGIKAAAAINDLPLARNGGIAIRVEPPHARPNADDVYARLLIVSEEYFRTMGVAVLRGRSFTSADDGTSGKVAIIGATMARDFWGDEDPIGKTFSWGGDTAAITVVGEVADVREAGLDRRPGMQMYFPARTQMGANIALIARGTLSAQALQKALVDAVRSVDRAQAVYNVRAMRDVVDASVGVPRANTMLISLFGALAVVIAGVGVYAVTTYAVAQRARELGIRAALGASRRDLARHVGSEVSWVALIGVGVGAALAWALARVMTSLVYGINVHDVGTFIAAPLVLTLIVLVAAAAPTRRAMRADPARIMREE